MTTISPAIHHEPAIHHKIDLEFTPEPFPAGTHMCYIARLNLRIETHPLTAIYQYDANQFDGATLVEILQVHPMMVVSGQVVRNPYYIPAPAYLARRGLPLDG